MGRLKNGINGPFSGKIGTVVGASCRGVDYARSLPRKSGKPATPAQQKQRDKFGLIMGWLKPLLELINIGYQILAGDKTPMNRAVSYHLTEAVIENNGELEIDFKNAVFSRGELIVSWVLEFLCLASKIIHIKWENVAESSFNKANDKASFIVYNPAKEQFVTFQHVALRADLKTSLQMPADFENDSVHCWMSYVNEAGDMVSTSSYLGELLIT